MVFKYSRVAWAESSTVSEIGCTHRHHDALYDDIISAHPFKFGWPIRRPDTPIQPIRAHIRINGFFLVGVGLGAEISTPH